MPVVCIPFAKTAKSNAKSSSSGYHFSVSLPGIDISRPATASCSVITRHILAATNTEGAAVGIPNTTTASHGCCPTFAS